MQREKRQVALLISTGHLNETYCFREMCLKKPDQVDRVLNFLNKQSSKQKWDADVTRQTRVSVINTIRHQEVGSKS